MFIDTLRHFAANSSALPAVITDGLAISYSQLWTEVDALTAWLYRQGVRPAETVGLTVCSEYPHLLAALALMRLGCVHITLPSYESSEYRFNLAVRAGVQRQVVEHVELGLTALPVLVLPHETPCVVPDMAPAIPIRAHAPCVYFASSGTTGRPKLILVSQQQIYQQAMNWQFPLCRDVLWRPTPIEHNNSKRQRLYSIVTGSINVFADATGRPLVDVIEAQRVTRLNLSVVQSRRLMDELRAAGRRLPEYCALRIGGSAIGPDLRAALRETVTPNLHVGYATTEFGTISTAGPDHQRGLGNAGRTHPGVELDIVDATNYPLPAGETGFIRVRGPGMASAYFNDDEATCRAFRNGWFHPGDMGRVDADGLLYVVGRADDMMSLASINIFPSEIEAAFANYPGVVECVALAVKSSHFGDIPVLAVIADLATDLIAMQRFGRDRLGLRAPRKVFRVESIPRNPAGKVLNDRLRELFEQQRSGDRL